MIVVPFEARHIFLLLPQPSQFEEVASITMDMAKQLEGLTAMTAIHDGEVLACAGVLGLHRNRGLAWTYISANAGKHFIQLHRLTKAYLDALQYNRVEMDVAYGFEQGHRWARLLGFEVECPLMRKYFADGGDATRYVRIR